MNKRNDSIASCNLDVDLNGYYLFQKLFNGYFTVLVIFLGTIGNLFSIKHIKLSKFDKNRGASLAINIANLAVWDNLLLWFIFIYYGYSNIKSPGKLDQMTISSFSIIHYCTQVCNTSSIWHVVAITIQRYMASRDPFTTKRPNCLMNSSCRSFSANENNSIFSCLTTLIAYRKHFKTTFYIVIFSLIVNIPAYFEFQVTECFNNLENNYQDDLKPTALRMNKHYKFWYRTIFRMIVGTMCPSLFIFGLTLLTNKAVRGSNRSRKLLFQMTDALLERFNSKETMQTAISLMLIVKFLVFRSSLFALDIWELAWIFIYEKDTRFPEAFNYIKDISNFLVTLNSATNCIIFMKAADWIEISMFRKKSTHLRKTPCLLENLTMCTRAYILQNTWQKIRQMTEDDFGSRVLVSMIRLDNKLNGKMIQAINDKKSMMDEGMRGSLESVVVSINSESSAKCSVQTKIVACNSFESNSLMSGYNKISMPLSEIIVSPYFIKMATNISSMMETVIKMMCEGKRETEIKAFIRRIGSIHSHKEVTFSNVAWKAFKTTTIDLVKECVYDSESEKGQALDAWNSFICMIIVEMKLGQWEPGNIL